MQVQENTFVLANYLTRFCCCIVAGFVWKGAGAAQLRLTLSVTADSQACPKKKMDVAEVQHNRLYA
jgi:hypothetical protein